MIHKPLFPNSGNYRPVAKRNLIKKQNRIKKRNETLRWKMQGLFVCKKPWLHITKTLYLSHFSWIKVNYFQANFLVLKMKIRKKRESFFIREKLGVAGR